MDHRIAGHRRAAVKAPVELLGVKASTMDANFKVAVAGLVLLVKRGLGENSTVVDNKNGCSVFDVANRIIRRQANSVGSSGEPNAWFKQGRGLPIAKIPQVAVGIEGSVGKANYQFLADRIYVCIKIDACIGSYNGFEVNFHHAQVAVSREPCRTDYPWSGREALPSAGRADRLKDVSAWGKARGSSVYVLAGGSAKKSSIR